MRLELTIGDSHLVRFPVERRLAPSLDLLRKIAPEQDHIAYLIESFKLDVSVSGIRDEAMQGMMAHIAECDWSGAQNEKDTELNDIQADFVARATKACHQADAANNLASAALTLSVKADAKGDHMASVLQAQADSLMTKAARRLVQAHMRIEEANGVADAIDHAKNTALGLIDANTMMEQMCEAQLRSRKR
jgi:hypothetical protein